jgi:hypothetical protein
LYRCQSSLSLTCCSIAEELSSSDIQLFYELIQNADDASYTEAAKLKDPPYLTFSVLREELIVDTNEDGFEKKDIKAICSTGNSSKKPSPNEDADIQGPCSTENNSKKGSPKKQQIGEKGFGFKSVFRIANIVHIQSGPWSFYFEHHQGDDGLGMVTPIHTPPQDLPKGVRTRISLKYKPEHMEEFDAFLKELRKELPNTVIFFLNEIRKVSILIEEKKDQIECTELRIEKIRDNSPRLVILTEQRTLNGQPIEEKDKDVQHFHTFCKTIYGLPKETRRANKTKADVQLAFPFDTASGEPFIDKDGQYAFAYLPLHRLAQIPVMPLEPTLRHAR